jgi:hypothetical protein
MSGWRSAIRDRRRRLQLRAERDPSSREPRARSRPTLPVPRPGLRAAGSSPGAGRIFSERHNLTAVAYRSGIRIYPGFPGKMAREQGMAPYCLRSTGIGPNAILRRSPSGCPASLSGHFIRGYHRSQRSLIPRASGTPHLRRTPSENPSGTRCSRARSS